MTYRNQGTIWDEAIIVIHGPLFSTEPKPKVDPALEDFQFASAFGQTLVSSGRVDSSLSLFCPDGAQIEIPSDIVSYEKTRGLLSLIEDKAIQDVGTYIQRTVSLFRDPFF